MLQTKWIIYAGWSLFGFFLVGTGIGLSWGQTAIMAMVASFAILSAIRLDNSGTPPNRSRNAAAGRETERDLARGLR